MRVFADSNVWVSAFATRGLCADLIRNLLRAHQVGAVTLLTADAVVRETERILVDKFDASAADLVPVRTAMSAAFVLPAGGAPPDNIPDPDDAPIIAAALAGNVQWFITGDKALLALKLVAGMRMVPPREMYEGLRGLR